MLCVANFRGVIHVEQHSAARVWGTWKIGHLLRWVGGVIQTPVINKPHLFGGESCWQCFMQALICLIDVNLFKRKRFTNGSIYLFCKCVNPFFEKLLRQQVCDPCKHILENHHPIIF